ncbi:MAG: hypothetical protein M3N28_03505 [Actinomycetota bacterium]|nr:hypothetical protein [Actinomycetota bacterium]
MAERQDPEEPTQPTEPTEPKDARPPEPGPATTGPRPNGSSSPSRDKVSGSKTLPTTRVPSRPGARRPGRPAPTPRRWMLVAAGVLFVGLFGLVLVRGLNSGPKLPPRTVEDQEFVRQANAACARRLPELRKDRARRRTGDESKEAALAGTVDRTSNELERLTTEVRGLPVGGDDSVEVSRWLDDWDAYVATGRRFADSLRRRDNKSYAAISAESTELSERIYAFSEANGISECVF